MKFYLLLNALFSCLFLFGQTIISGTISTDQTWSLANSPYLIQSNTLVEPNVTITIEPGVVVEGNPGATFVTRGNLYAIGTESDSIYFKSAVPGNNWYGFTWDYQYMPNGAFEYIHVEDANTFLFFENYSGPDTSVYFKNSLFVGNSRAIYQDDEYSLNVIDIDSCQFINHNGIVIENPGRSRITNCLFQNSNWGIYNTESESGLIERCVFDNNYFAVYSIGIIQGCEFFNNETALSCSGYNFLAQYNNIHDNEIGFRFHHSSVSNSPEQFQYNKVCDNLINIQASPYADATMQYNCFCTTDLSSIEATIEDFFDDAYLSLVDIGPLDTTCSQWSTLDNEIHTIQSKKFEIYPNPFQDFVNIKDYQEDMISYKILDLQGRITKSGKLGSKKIELPNLDSGYYALYVFGKKNQLIFFRKLIKN